MFLDSSDASLYSGVYTTKRKRQVGSARRDLFHPAELLWVRRDPLQLIEEVENEDHLPWPSFGLALWRGRYCETVAPGMQIVSLKLPCGETSRRPQPGLLRSKRTPRHRVRCHHDLQAGRSVEQFV